MKKGSYGSIPILLLEEEGSSRGWLIPPIDDDVPPPPPPPEPTLISSVSILVSALLASLATGGPTYAFGLYGSTLKQTLHLSQTELDTISSANFCAGLLSWIPGICVDRWGPRLAMIVGGFVQSVFLLLYWVVSRQFFIVLRHFIVPSLSILGVLIFMSNSLVIGGLFKILMMSSGPGKKGSAVGAAKGYLGLGAGTYACIFDALKGGNESDLDFLPMCALFCLIAITLPSAAFLPSKENLYHIQDVSTDRHYRVIYFGLLLLGLFVLGTTSLLLFLPTEGAANKQETTGNGSSSDSGNADAKHIVRALLILLAWVVPITSLLFLPKASATAGIERKAKSFDDLARDELHQPPSSPFISTFVGESPRPLRRIPSARDYSLLEMMKTPTAWLFLWTCTIMVGSGTIITNNIGQMIKTLDFQSRTAVACLALFSVAQAVARVITGTVSESAIIERGVPRPAFLIVASLLAVIAHSILGAASTYQVAFVMGVVCGGIAFGMVWPLMVLIIGEVFGTANHGANYMFYDGFASAVGTLLISKLIAQEVYEAHIEHHDADDDDELNCYGSQCFSAAHWITAALCLTCLCTSIGMLRSTKMVYRNMK